MGWSFLCSYYHWKDGDLVAELTRLCGEMPRVFVDSGAFSAKTIGAKITCADYAAWLKRWQEHITVYANLDVIGNWKATADNQRRLEEVHGLSPLPVFHWGSPYAELDRLCDRYPYIALGGLVGLSKRVMLPHIAECFRIAGSRTKFHGFGVTYLKAVMSFPWRSVDSSTWTYTRRFMLLLVLDTERMTIANHWVREPGDPLYRVPTARERKLYAQNGLSSDLHVRTDLLQGRLQVAGLKTMLKVESLVQRANPDFILYQVMVRQDAGRPSLLQAFTEMGARK